MIKLPKRIKRKAASFSLPIDLLDELRELAESSDVAASAIVEACIREGLADIREQKQEQEEAS